MYYIGLDVHKKTISYCVKDVSGQIHRQGTIGATRDELGWWVKTLPQPWIVEAMCRRSAILPRIDAIAHPLS